MDCPRLRDVENMLTILRMIGCKANWVGENDIIIDPSGANSHEMPDPLSKELRSSIFMLGPLLGRFKKAVATFPGGCEIGLRPIDLHLKALEAFGVKVTEKYGHIYCDGEGCRQGKVHLDYPSVGATENAMMAAVCIKGESHITNAAREPEIVDLANFLNALGYDVRGAGSSNIVIYGTGKMMGKSQISYRILPDRIVAGTYMCASVIAGGSVHLTNVCPEHIASISAKLTECGANIVSGVSEVTIHAPERPKEIKLIETGPYPGFPTDMQSQFFALCTIASGVSVLVEKVFENRFTHGAQLMRMGADCTIKDRTAIIRGVDRLTGATVDAHDLRGGAALVLAGLRAEGITVVRDAKIIDRGYECIQRDLHALGADIVRQEYSD